MKFYNFIQLILVGQCIIDLELNFNKSKLGKKSMSDITQVGL